MMGEREKDCKSVSWSPLVNGEVSQDCLDLLAEWKDSRKVLVCADCDLFQADVPDEHIDRVFDAMWECARHDFWVETQNVDRLVEYVRGQRRAFGWTDLGRGPMGPGDCSHLDTVYYRNECGYRYDGRDDQGERLDWACEHPDNEDRLEECSCSGCTCPIADRADTRQQLKDIGVIDDYSEFFRDKEGTVVGADDDPRPDDYVEDTDWMYLCSRPKDAMCANVWLGFSASDQQSFEKKARIFRVLRDNPHQKLFCRIGESINMNIPYHGDGESDDSLWSPCDQRSFSHGGEKVLRPYMDRIIVIKDGGGQ